MSGVITPNFSAELLKGYFHGYNPSYPVEIALTRRVPVANAGTNQLDEPLGGGYRRSNTVALNAANWPLVSPDNQVYNAVAIDWPLDCTVGWGTINGWAILSTGASPMVLVVGEFNTPTRFTPGMRPRIAANVLTFGLFD